MKKNLFNLWIVSIVLILLLAPFTQNKPVHADETSTLRVGWTREPDSLSPYISNRVVTFELHLLLYDPLVAIDNDLKPEGRLAKDWTVSDDNLTWTFNLVEGVNWHDGEPFTSEDVKFSYESLLKTETGMYADFLQGITSIETPDDLTVVIKTEKPKADMLYVTAPIVPKHIWEKVDFDELATWPNDNPIGTGAFKFIEWKKGEYVKLEANKDYFLGSPKFDELIYLLYANNDTMIQSLKIGEIDAAINVNSNQVEQLKKEQNIQVISNPTIGFTSIGINSWQDKASKGNPLLLNPKIKHAMEYAIDKQKVIDVAFSGQGKVGTTIIPSTLSDWHKELSDEQAHVYNPDRANQILDEEGFTDKNGDGIRVDKNGNPLEFRFYLRSDTPEEVKAGQMIHAMWKEVGIGTKVETMDDGVLDDRIYDDADFDLFIWGWGPDIDPTTILSIVTTEQIESLSDTYYSNQKYDELIGKQSTTIEFEERQKIVHEMQEILAEDPPYFILMEENAIQAIRTDKWEGWTEVLGSYFLGANHYNYLHVQPVLEDAGKEAASKTKSKNNSWIVFAGIGALLLIIVIALMMRRRKGIDQFDDM